ncbi:MAG: hypothetical protein RSD14_05835 [Clostridia bacterium]
MKLSQKDLNIKLDEPENGQNAIENALIKAREAYRNTNMNVIGMDDSLYLENVPERADSAKNNMGLTNWKNSQ